MLNQNNLLFQGRDSVSWFFCAEQGEKSGFCIGGPLRGSKHFQVQSWSQVPTDSPEAPKWWIRWACPRAIFFLVLVLSNEVWLSPAGLRKCSEPRNNVWNPSRLWHVKTDFRPPELRRRLTRHSCFNLLIFFFFTDGFLVHCVFY